MAARRPTRAVTIWQSRLTVLPSIALTGQGGLYAVFFVLVEDVDAACREVERHGGKIAVPPKTAASGLRFVHPQ